MPENNEEQPDFESRLIENNAFVDMAIWDFWVPINFMFIRNKLSDIELYLNLFSNRRASSLRCNQEPLSSLEKVVGRSELLYMCSSPEIFSFGIKF